MSTNGKGSKRRPESKPGVFVKNWDSINWAKKETHRPRPRFDDPSSWPMEPDAVAYMPPDPEKEEYHPPLD